MNTQLRSAWQGIWTLAVVLAIVGAAVREVGAQAINSDFESGLTGWHVNAGGVVAPAADDKGGFAALQEAGKAGSPASSSLYQDFTVPVGQSLVFEYILVTNGTFVGGSALPDAFTARLLNPITLVPLISTAGVNDYFYNDSPGNIDFDSLVVTRAPSTTRAGWFTVTADVSAVPVGTFVRLQFDLLGTGVSDGQLTIVGLDGIEVLDIGPVDQCPGDPAKTAPGVCGCGVPDVDTDGDGVLDCQDGCPNDPGKTQAGACGCGVADLDADGDGTPDCLDGCPDDPNKTAPGVCGCGVADADSDGDGRPDCLDRCPNDPHKTSPGACGCGVPDTDSDGDGTSDCLDACSDDANKTEPGVCGCGTEDADTDGDGVPDCNDACPSDPYKAIAGACGCGLVDTDTDGDGTPDCHDACPNDPSKTTPGTCGCNVPDADSDGDVVPDCVDNCPSQANPGQQDTDGDGIGDACEGDTGRPDPTNTNEERRVTTVVTRFMPCGAIGAAPLPLMLLALVVMKCMARSWRRDW